MKYLILFLKKFPLLLLILVIFITISLVLLKIIEPNVGILIALLEILSSIVIMSEETRESLKTQKREKIWDNALSLTEDLEKYSLYSNKFDEYQKKEESQKLTKEENERGKDLANKIDELFVFVITRISQLRYLSENEEFSKDIFKINEQIRKDALISDNIKKEIILLLGKEFSKLFNSKIQIDDSIKKEYNQTIQETQKIQEKEVFFKPLYEKNALADFFLKEVKSDSEAETRDKIILILKTCLEKPDAEISEKEIKEIWNNEGVKNDNRRYFDDTHFIGVSKILDNLDGRRRSERELKRILKRTTAHNFFIEKENITSVKDQLNDILKKFAENKLPMPIVSKLFNIKLNENLKNELDKSSINLLWIEIEKNKEIIEKISKNLWIEFQEKKASNNFKIVVLKEGTKWKIILENNIISLKKEFFNNQDILNIYITN